MNSLDSSAQHAIDACRPFAAIAPARIGKGMLQQHAVRLLGDGPVFLLASALGAPRLWDYLLGGALDGFEEGYQRPHDGKASTRLHQGMLVAQMGVRRRVDNLIERRMSDVGLIALALENDLLHVLSVGPLRAYLYRARTLARIGPDLPEEPAPARSSLAGAPKLFARAQVSTAGIEGLLKATPCWSAEQVAPGDVVLATSVHPGADAALQGVRSALDSGQPTPEVLVELLNAGPNAAGRAAAAIALQVPIS